MTTNDRRYPHRIGIIGLRYSEETNFEPSYFDITLIGEGTQYSDNVLWANMDVHIPDTRTIEARLFIKTYGHDDKRLHRVVTLPVPQTRRSGFLRAGARIVDEDHIEIYLCDRESVTENLIENATKTEVYKPIPDVLAREGS